MVQTTGLVVELDDRWDECYTPEERAAAWPPDGFMTRLFSSGIPPHAEAVACLLADCAARRVRRVPLSADVENGVPPGAMTLLSLHTLADRGFVTLTSAGGVG